MTISPIGVAADKQAAVTGIGVAAQNERRPIRELRVGQSVNRKLEDSEIAEGLGFELRFSCVRTEESHAAVRVCSLIS